MAAEVSSTAATNGLENSGGGGDMQHSGAGLLVIIGEPFSDDHNELIVAEITKGFKSWDIEVCDINGELAGVVNSAGSGEEGSGGERIVTYSSGCLQTEVLVNPQCSTVRNRLYSLIGSPLQYKYIIFAGHMIQGSGAWVLQDNIFGPDQVIQIVKDTPDADLKDSLITIHCLEEGDWSTAAFAKQLKGTNIKVNPEGKLTEIAGVMQFTAYASNFIHVQQVEDILQSSDVVGNIRFSKPTLYIFPGGQGDSALFGISGFNLLVNGGFNRKACFWDFTRHLDRIDALLLTHLGADNIFAVSSVMQRKAAQSVHPEIGYIYYNAIDKVKHSTNGESPRDKSRGLLINVLDEGNRIVENLKLQGQSPASCVRPNSSEPINLYHKVGHGSLDMYILNPQQDSKELKDFLLQWSKKVPNISACKPGQIPLPDSVSVCSLLVWQPANKSENITRILFPGNVPQQKVFEGLDKLKALDFLKFPQCTDDDLHNKKKPVAGKSAAKSVTKAGTSKLGIRTAGERKGSDAKTDSKTASKSPSPPKQPTKKVNDAKKGKTPPSKSSPSVKSPGDKPKELAPVPVVGAVPPVPVGEPTPPAPIVEAAPPAPVEPIPPPPTKKEPEPIVEPVAPAAIDEPVAPAPIVEPVAPAPIVEASPPASDDPLLDFGIPPPETPPEPKAESLPDPIIPVAPVEPALIEDDVLLATKDSPTEDALTPDDTDEPSVAEVVNETPASLDDLEPAPTGDLLGEKLEPADVPNGLGDPFIDTPSPADPPSADLLGDLDTPQALPDPAVQLEAFGQPVLDTQEPMKGHVEEEDVSSILPSKQEDLSTLEPEEIESETTQPDQALLSQSEPIEAESTQPDQAFFQPEPIEPESAQPDQAFFSQPEPIEPESTQSDQAFFSQPEPIEPESTQPDQAFFSQPEPIEPESTQPDQAFFSQPEPIEPESTQPDQAFFSQPEPIEPESTQPDQAFFSQPEPIEPESTQPDQAFFSQPEPIEPEPAQPDQAFFSQPEPIEPEPAQPDQAFFSQPEPIEPESTQPDQVLFQQEPIDSDKIFLEEASHCDTVEQPGNDDPSEKAKLAELGIFDDEAGSLPSHEKLDSQKLAELGIFDEESEKDVDTTETQYLQHSPEDVENANVPMDQRIMAEMGIYDEDDSTNANRSEPTQQESSRESSIPSDSQSRETPDTEIEMDDKPAEEASVQSSIETTEKDVADVNLVHQPDPFVGTDSNDPFQPEPLQIQTGEPSEPFDPLKDWDEPMGLPSPPPPEDKTASATANDVNHKPTTKKPATRKPASATAKTTDVKKKSPTSPTKPLTTTTRKTTTEKKGDTTSTTKTTTVEKKGNATSTTKTSTTTTRNAAPLKKTRPTSAPVKDAKENAAPATKKALASKPASAKTRPTSTASASPKPKALAPVSPFYVDLTYVPNHGNAQYCDLEFFRRVRARYYVVSSLNPSAHVLNSLLEAKQTWEDKDLEVTVIPTYDNDTLRHWMGLHRDKLTELKIDVAPSASRCTIQLQDHETSCAAYRLEF
ncbi:uncharacterized protein LOC141905669 [Tubulanus polymorphus]|uniref:uncharacterized protein LOC141905669 n=1 Tax=Tubulanus polymorphus TaxID=672921 RepID=UPI003DA53F48